MLYQSAKKKPTNFKPQAFFLSMFLAISIFLENFIFKPKERGNATRLQAMSFNSEIDPGTLPKPTNGQ